MDAVLRGWVTFALVVATILTQVVLLVLQAHAFWRHGHRSFLLLSLATACGLIYLSAMLSVYVFPRYWGNAQVALVVLTAAVLIAQMMLGVWGTVSLLRTYRRLAEAAGKTRTGE
jgi:hypothetical protein